MEMTQMNTRIPATLKSAGDEVLARYGKTASEVMRAVWSWMVAHQELPVCAQDSGVEDEATSQTLEAIQKQSKALGLLCEEVGITWKYEPMPYANLRDAMYEDRLAEYEALHD